jgi:hypothetical protein
MVLGGVLTALSYYILKLRTVKLSELSPTDWLLPPLFILSSLSIMSVKIYDAIQGEPGALPPLIGLIVILLAFLSHRVYRVIQR